MVEKPYFDLRHSIWGPSHSPKQGALLNNMEEPAPAETVAASPSALYRWQQ